MPISLIKRQKCIFCHLSTFFVLPYTLRPSQMAYTLCMMNVLWEFITTWIMHKILSFPDTQKGSSAHYKTDDLTEAQCEWKALCLITIRNFNKRLFSLPWLCDETDPKGSTMSGALTELFCRNFPILYSWIRATFVLNINCELESLIDVLLYIYYYIDIPLYLIVLEYIKFPSLILMELQ